ncbi:Uncharacterised protein [Mycobacteroides abscessus subsp. abscessus]|nr:Uncharacterised protein [Mycobacteroides abscessus subsp. abscessus]
MRLGPGADADCRLRSGCGRAAAALCAADLARRRSRAASIRGGTYGSGSGSRSSLFIRSPEPARRAATASGSWRAALAIKPMKNSAVAVDVPPEEISGSWIPVTGSRPMTYPMLMKDWPIIHSPAVAVIMRKNGSALRRAIRIAVYAKTPNRASTPMQPTNPSSSPMMAKMKSLCAFGR